MVGNTNSNGSHIEYIDVVKCVLQTVPSTDRYLLWLYDSYISNSNYHAYRFEANGTTKQFSLGSVSNGTLTTLFSANEIKYIDVTCSVPSSGQVQINSSSGGVINYVNFISGCVIDSNSISVDFYTYNNLIYGYFHGNTNMTAVSGTIKVRCWYKA